MHTMNTRGATSRRWLATGAIALLATVASATTLRAQTPTPEGTTITNTATASWTDANGNTYTPVTAQASVTVGYLAAPDVTSPASVTPASPSTGNSIPFVITNSGNGTDQFSVGVTGSTGVSITGYTVGATTYTDIASLNAALALVNVASGSSVTVNVNYDVDAGRGGLTSPVSLTATSVRTPSATGASDASTTNVIPPVSAAVAVTPDGGTISRLPSNGTQYSQTFVVANNGNATDLFNLNSSSGAAVTIVSVNGTAGTTGTVSVGAGSTQNVTVVYTVGNVAAGTTAALTLIATSSNNGAITDAGFVTISVVRPAITMTKAAFRDDQTTAVTGTVLPGEYIWYQITVTNGGTAAASSVSISDPLPAQVTYDTASGDAAGWTISQASGTVTANLTGTLATGASRYIWVRVRIN